jgi:rubrerythrin
MIAATGPSTVRTFKNLKEAYARAAQAYMRLHFCARLADARAQGDLAQMLRATAEEERRRALIFLQTMADLGVEDRQLVNARLESNVEAVIGARRHEAARLYRRYAEAASEEGFPQIARQFQELAGRGLAHAELLQQWQRPSAPPGC